MTAPHHGWVGHPALVSRSLCLYAQRLAAFENVHLYLYSSKTANIHVHATLRPIKLLEAKSWLP